ncbi:MAG: tetratricopeptide repeat protein [Alphaproteobacteria bacterium]|nr:tetratricopeptide repeat protein [Alphaproteobacteria bacterium]
MQPDPEGLLAVLAHVAPRFTTRLGMTTVLALAISAFIWGSPVSPVAVWRGDLLVASGRPEAAVEAYDAVARSNPFQSVQQSALERGGNTLAMDLGDVHGARLRFELLLGLTAEPRQQAALLERIGGLLLAEGDEANAVVRLREAHDLFPQAPEAADRLTRAATIAAHAGDLVQADRLWRRLGKKHPERTALAELGRADVALRQGRIQDALTAYVRASDHTFDPDLAAAAKFGSSICLERLGDLEEALADLDEAELPSTVFEERAEQMRDRLPTR